MLSSIAALGVRRLPRQIKTQSYMVTVFIVLSVQNALAAVPISGYKCSEPSAPVYHNSGVITYGPDYLSAYEDICPQLSASYVAFKNTIDPDSHSFFNYFRQKYPQCRTGYTNPIWAETTRVSHIAHCVQTQVCEPINGLGWVKAINGQCPDVCPSPSGGAESQQNCLPSVVDNPTPETGKPDCGAGNPCNVATGNKYQSEIDFSFAGLNFTRSYNSKNLANTGLGLGWRSNFNRKLIVDSGSLTQVSDKGRGETFSSSGSQWIGNAAIDNNITEDASGFTLNKPDGSSERYDLAGKLLSTTDRNGGQENLNYNAQGQLESVVNQYGQSISFEYSTYGYLVAVTDPAGNEYKYVYAQPYNLKYVIYPDSTPDDDLDNPRRRYHYDDPNFPNHLTGITDANGNRFATWAYDSNGNAISSEHAITTNGVGQEKVTLDFQGGQN